MSQTACPIADINVGAWSGAPLYEKLDEESPNDSDYVSISAPDLAPFEIKIDGLIGPPWKEGQRRFTVRLRRTSSEQVSVRIQLLQGSTVIADWMIRPSQTFTDATVSLTDEQVNSITDFTDLRVRVTATCDSVSTLCCPSRLLNKTLWARITEKSGSAGCLPDNYPLTLSSPGTWDSNPDVGENCVSTSHWVVFCTGGSWRFSGTNVGFNVPPQSVSCEPLELDFGTFDSSGLANGEPGSFKVVVAETPQ